jgi:gliding motility-associated-like protein
MELSLEVPVVNDNCGIQSVTNDFSSTADAGGIYPVGTTTVTYTATDQSGNTSQCSRQVIIRLGDDVPNGLVIPQGFSPNNDGLNDTFEIIGIGLYPENELHVYNVWGKEVFSMDGYDNSWDGKASTGVSSGEKLPTGTYYYILKLGNDRVVKGFVYLILE